MKKIKKLECQIGGKHTVVPVRAIHTIVLGSGAAGLNAAAQLYLNGVMDVLILTEGLKMGTSINTGSDKQTYYKLSMCGNDLDSPRALAETYFANGSMHGDLALVEASGSARAFLNLVNLGVPFPRDEYGQFVGYKTDHDPLQRATSIGPYTSREMCRRLIAQVKDNGIEIAEGRTAVELIRLDSKPPRIAGLIAINPAGDFEAYLCENIVFAVGGPGGLYKTSVYPAAQTGAIGLALMAGASASNLQESQFGLASIKFRWNVSGTYMQVIPRVISRDKDGISDEKEFINEFFKSPSELHGMLFLKGYQWPFDANKVIGGSSIIDVLVYIETVSKNRRVYLDYRANPEQYSLEELPDEARHYLKRSGAIQDTPIGRLMHMNPQAVELYKSHKIDLFMTPLEVAVCAQHNNGGLAGNSWYESINLKHIFPIGEVNGSHGVTRPGGSALNAGQVAGFRAAEYIARQYSEWTVPEEEALSEIRNAMQNLLAWDVLCQQAKTTWLDELHELQERMSNFGAHIRSRENLQQAVTKAQEQVTRLKQNACNVKTYTHRKYAFRLRQLAFAQLVYLEAIKYFVESKVGSRGSAIILDPHGELIHEKLDQTWRMVKEDKSFRDQVLETVSNDSGNIQNHWVPVRPIPEPDSWFETTWAKFRNDEIYR